MPATTRIIALIGDLAFGSVPAEMPVTRTLTIANVGNGLLTVSRITFPPGFNGFFAGTIPAGGSRDVTVTFAPGPTTYSGTVMVWANQTGGSTAISASGTGIQTSTRVIGLSGNLAFGNVTVGTTATRTLTISNSGSAPLTVSGIRYPMGFSGAWSGVVGPGASQQVTVTFVPTASGAYGDALVVDGNYTSGTNALGLSGTGVAASAPVITTDPANQIIEPGGTVTFVAAASASPTATVQWQVSAPGASTWTDIAGAVSTAYSVVATRMDNGKRFRAVFRNVMGTAISNPATLRVYGPSLIWQHQTNGSISLWRMAGTEQVQGLALTPSRVADTNWKIVGTGDFNNDGQQDLLWHHQTQGWVSVWFMDGTRMIAGVSLNPDRVADTNWKVVATGDFNGDGQRDILWQHSTNGLLATWLMNGTMLMDGRLLTPGHIADANWRMVGSGDFNGDGMTDIVWQNTFGYLCVWLMNGSTLLEGVWLNPNQVADTNWKIRAVSDVNGDGQADLIWQHVTTGAIAAWMMSGTTQISGTLLTPPAVGDLDWRIVGPK